MNIQPKKRKETPALKITKRVKDSGFLAVHEPEVLQTLIALSCFADKAGQCLISLKELAQTLNISLGEAKERIDSLLEIRWKLKPLIVKEGRDNSKYRLLLSEEFELI